MTETATGTLATPATEAAAPASGLAAATKSANVESVLASAAKAAAVAPEVHDAEAETKAQAEAYSKLKADGVHADVLKVIGEAFGENKVAPEAAQKLLDKVLPAMNARREAEVKEQIAAADKQWQDELRADKEFGGDKWDANAKVVDQAIKALDPEGYEGLKASGLMGHPSLNRIVLRAEAILAKATKQDTVVVGAAPGAPKDDLNDLSNAALSRALYGTKKE